MCWLICARTKKLSHDKFLANLLQWYNGKVIDRLLSTGKATIVSNSNVDSTSDTATSTTTTTAAASSIAVDPHSKKRERAEEPVVASSSSSSSTRVPLVEPAKAATQSKVARVEESILCCVCEDAEANTIAVPCGHRVVCRQCSVKLNKDGDNSTRCVVCRQTITHVGYPDNTMKATSSSHSEK